MTSPKLHRSHDRVRLEPARLRELAPLPAGAAGKPTRTRARPYRAALRALMSTLRAAGADGEATTPETAAMVRETMRVFRGVLHELGGTRSPSARAAVLAFAVQSAAAQRILIAAFEAGVATDRGLALIDHAQRVQGRAERSWTAAVAALGLLRGTAPAPGAEPPPWLVAADDDGGGSEQP